MFVSMRNGLNRILMMVFCLFAASVCPAQTAPQALTAAGLKESVTVRRDERGIPYIEATGDADLYFAQGFVTAQDRLWQMDVFRRVARGELAEIFGRQILEEDKRWRRFGFAKIVEDGLPSLSPELRAALESYSRGVNAYIATLDDKTLPVEFRILQYKPREWRTTDSMIIGKILADALSSTWQTDLLRGTLQNLPKEKLADLTNNVTPYDVVLFGKDAEVQSPRSKVQSQLRITNYELRIADKETEIRRSSLERIGFYAEELAASNNWVISGKRTLDGKPILANDPHLLSSAPNIWYLSHLAAPNVRVSGVTFPGVPGIVLGHNEFIAWGATNVGPDVQDLYREQFDAQNRVKTPRGWEQAKTRREEIKVRPNPLSPATETEVLEVFETRNGVVITEEAGRKLALKWTALDPKNQEFEAFFALNRARNWEDFKNALRKYGGATQNFVYADVAGNIGWYAAGRIPIRRTGEGELPYDGATDAGDWTGYIPFDELPHLYNPAEGFIVTANQRIVGNSYKYQQVSRDAAPPWRARRIYDLINANPKITMNDVRDIQYDSFNIPLSNMAREIVKVSALPEVKQLLGGWDGRMTADSKGAVVANEIRNCLANQIAGDNLPVPSYVIRERIVDWAVREKSARWLPKRFAGYADLVNACEKDSLASLEKRLGADKEKWVWGNVFQARFQHPLAIAPLIGAQFMTKPVGLNGSGQTPNVGSYVSMRLITSPGNWDATRHVIPLGQSGNPQSPHWKDQFEAWRTGSPQIFPFSKDAVMKASKEIVTLQPK
ncbi:MAG TPA: penicillin acylase family protein [Pyrinomonadaceae bacterium]|jgi:penicillin amidase